MTLSDFLFQTEEIKDLGHGISLQLVRPIVMCADGFEISIQASANHHCCPRRDGLKHDYTSLELGFPSRPDEHILEYAEDKDAPTQTVYGMVPIRVVEKLLAKHGGISRIFNK